uniref:MutS_0 protein n=1 Tax=Fopius arisanus TaxID=64838 RepID=A0A0C9RCC8_9HYME
MREYQRKIKNSFWNHMIRKGQLFVEAPKLKLEISSFLSDIAKKKDQHFVGTENYVGTAIAALGDVVSSFLDPPDEGLDESAIVDSTSHAGPILVDVFHQQTMARKSFITPQMSKSIKPVADIIFSDEWLYGDNLKDKLKEMEKVCLEMKDKGPQKPTPKQQYEGNSKYPPAKSRQVGQQLQQKRPLFNPETKIQTAYSNSSRTHSGTTNQSSSRK